MSQWPWFPSRFPTEEDRVIRRKEARCLQQPENDVRRRRCIGASTAPVAAKMKPDGSNVSAAPTADHPLGEQTRSESTVVQCDVGAAD